MQSTKLYMETFEYENSRIDFLVQKQLSTDICLLHVFCLAGFFLVLLMLFYFDMEARYKRLKYKIKYAKIDQVV